MCPATHLHPVAMWTNLPSQRTTQQEGLGQAVEYLCVLQRRAAGPAFAITTHNPGRIGALRWKTSDCDTRRYCGAVRQSTQAGWILLNHARCSALHCWQTGNLVEEQHRAGCFRVYKAWVKSILVHGICTNLIWDAYYGSVQ